MSKVSSDERIEAILFAVAEKIKMGLDMEETVKRAKKDILDIWSEDMRQIEADVYTICREEKS
jgi:hypothetical protein